MQYLALLLLPFIAAYGVAWLVWAGVITIVDWIKALRANKRVRIERELDRQQAELRATILHLAGQLGADAHEARKALIRESYLASGQTPPKF